MIRKEISEYQARDEVYIDAFCEDPKAGKSAALIEAGYKGTYLAQEAYRIHRRLQNRIDQRLDEMINEGASLGYSVLKQLATSAQSETVQARCAEALMNYAGRKPGERVTIQNEPQTVEEIDNEIRVIAKRLRQQGVDVSELLGESASD